MSDDPLSGARRRAPIRTLARAFAATLSCAFVLGAATPARAAYPERPINLIVAYAAGGGTKNAVWGQATSDVSGTTQILRDKTIGASYGDAFLAALTIGDVARGDIDAWNPVASEIVPNATLRSLYDRHYGVFRSLYDSTRGLMREIEP